jgi:hypothetical protein
MKASWIFASSTEEGTTAIESIEDDDTEDVTTIDDITSSDVYTSQETDDTIDDVVASVEDVTDDS